MADALILPFRIEDKGSGQLDKIKTKVKGLSGPFSAFSGKTKQANASLKALNGTATKTVAGMGALKSAFAGLSAVVAIRKITSTIADFGRGMSTVRAITQATEEEFQKLNETARKLGATTEFTAKQAADGMVFLGQAGFKTAEILEAIPAVLDLATAGAVGLGEAADITSNILSGFGKTASETADVIDIMAATATNANTNILQLGSAMSFSAPIAGALGIDITELSAAIGILANAGIQGSRAGTNLNTFLAKLSDLTPEAKRELLDLGITMDELNPATHSLTEIIQRLSDANLGLAENAGRVSKIFGVRQVAAVVSLIKQIDAYKELLEVTQNAEGAAANMAGIIRVDLQGAFDELRSAVSEVSLVIGEAGFTEGLQSLAKALTELSRATGGGGPIRAIGGFMGDLLKTTVAVGEGLVIIKDAIIALGPAILTVGAILVAGKLLAILGPTGTLILGLTAAVFIFRELQDEGERAGFILSGAFTGVIITWETIIGKIRIAAALIREIGSGDKELSASAQEQINILNQRIGIRAAQLILVSDRPRLGVQENGGTRVTTFEPFDPRRFGGRAGDTDTGGTFIVRDAEIQALKHKRDSIVAQDTLLNSERLEIELKQTIGRIEEEQIKRQEILAQMSVDRELKDKEILAAKLAGIAAQKAAEEEAVRGGIIGSIEEQAREIEGSVRSGDIGGFVKGIVKDIIELEGKLLSVNDKFRSLVTLGPLQEEAGKANILDLLNQEFDLRKESLDLQIELNAKRSEISVDAKEQLGLEREKTSLIEQQNTLLEERKLTIDNQIVATEMAGEKRLEIERKAGEKIIAQQRRMQDRERRMAISHANTLINVYGNMLNSIQATIANYVQATGSENRKLLVAMRAIAVVQAVMQAFISAQAARAAIYVSSIYAGPGAIIAAEAAYAGTLIVGLANAAIIAATPISMHHGGFVEGNDFGRGGLANDEAIRTLQRGEFVLSKNDIKNGALGGGKTVVQIFDQRKRGADIQVQETTTGNGNQLRIVVRDAVMDNLKRGEFDRGFGQRFDVSAQGKRR